MHELRYALAINTAPHDASHGHGYLPIAGPLLGLLTTALIAWLALRAAAHSGRGQAAVRLRRVWPLVSIGLLAVFGIQELVEGALSPGHPAGFEGVFGHGGWIAVPLAIAIGAIAAWTVRAVDRLASGPAPTDGWIRLALFDERRLVALTAGPGVLASPPMAGNRAGRAPPSQV